MKCMVAAGEKNGADIPTHCKGVDFDALKNGKASLLALEMGVRGAASSPT